MLTGLRGYPSRIPVLLDRARRLRTMAIALTALEARYLPALDSSAYSWSMLMRLNGSRTVMVSIRK